MHYARFTPDSPASDILAAAAAPDSLVELLPGRYLMDKIWLTPRARAARSAWASRPTAEPTGSTAAIRAWRRNAVLRMSAEWTRPKSSSIRNSATSCRP